MMHDAYAKNGQFFIEGFVKVIVIIIWNIVSFDNWKYYKQFLLMSKSKAKEKVPNKATV